MSVAIGVSSGASTQGVHSIAIGFEAGKTDQLSHSVAIGSNAGDYRQGSNSVAIGNMAGVADQGTMSVAIGPTAGNQYQSEGAVALGNSAGGTSQGANSVAIGTNSGADTQGQNSIAIGHNAGYTSQASNSIIINATGSILSTAQSNSFYVKPVRNNEGTNSLQYNPTTGEISYSGSQPTSSYPATEVSAGMSPAFVKSYRTKTGETTKTTYVYDFSQSPLFVSPLGTSVGNFNDYIYSCSQSTSTSAYLLDTGPSSSVIKYDYNFIPTEEFIIDRGASGTSTYDQIIDDYNISTFNKDNYKIKMIGSGTSTLSYGTSGHFPSRSDCIYFDSSKIGSYQNAVTSGVASNSIRSSGDSMPANASSNLFTSNFNSVQMAYRYFYFYGPNSFNYGNDPNNSPYFYGSSISAGKFIFNLYTIDK